MTLADRVIARLNGAQVAHATVGAAALAAAGVVRSSLDLDLLTLDTRVLDRSFWTELAGTGAAVDVRRGDHDDPLAGVVRATADGERPVDVIVGRYPWQQRAVDRAQALPSGERVVRPRDLVLLKLYAGGTQDLGTSDSCSPPPTAARSLPTWKSIFRTCRRPRRRSGKPPRPQLSSPY
jgi:hypothetical protein